MLDDFRTVAIVTARGGSKGLPRKNLRLLGDKPLIAWTINAAHAARCIDAVIVSTDDNEIAEVALQYGAEVPFLRPAILASDTATSIEVVEHALHWLAKAGRIYDVVVLLEPTSPLREASDIDRGVSQMIASGAAAVVSVCRAESIHPTFMYRQRSDARLVPFLGQQPTGLRRQEIEPLFFLEGTLYASKIDVLNSRRSFYHEDTIAYEVPKWKSIEIDDIDDFTMVEALAKHKGLTG